VIGPRIDWLIFLLLQIAHANHEARDAIGFIDRQNTLAEFDSLVDIAIRKRGNERAVQQFVVLGIGAQRRAIERGSRVGIPLHAGMTRSEVAAGHRQRAQIALAWKLRRIVGGMVGRLRQKRAWHCQRGEGKGGDRQAIETSGKHHGSP
jgi:hypothetical protein